MTQAYYFPIDENGKTLLFKEDIENFYQRKGINFKQVNINSNIWVDVKDEKPPFKKGILITDGNHILCAELEDWGNGDYWISPYKYGSYSGEWDEDLRGKITHWMELPELPNK